MMLLCDLGRKLDLDLFVELWLPGRGREREEGGGREEGRE